MEIQLLTNIMTSSEHRFHGIPSASVPARPIITNLDSLLEDIYTRFIALKNEDCQEYYSVFIDFFKQLQDAMTEVDAFYAKYSSTKQFAGSHFDHLRIVKPDEYDMCICINLPVNFKKYPLNHGEYGDRDISIQEISPAFVQMSMGKNNSLIYNSDYKWTDAKGLLLRDQFINWFRDVVVKGLNKIGFKTKTTDCWKVNVGRRSFSVTIKQKGSNNTAVAVSLCLAEDNSRFRLDMDLVPALKIPMDYWPITPKYRAVAKGCPATDWMLVPRPNIAAPENDHPRTWRVSLPEQEKHLMHDKDNMKKCVKMIKKLRGTLGLQRITSYFIKTLFFWEIEAVKDPTFWSKNSPTALFKIMVPKLHAAVVAGNFPFYWNKGDNLAAFIPRKDLNKYAEKLEEVMRILNQPTQYRQVARFLLTEAEYTEYTQYAKLF